VILLGLAINDLLPLIVFLVFMSLTWGAMKLLTGSKTQAEERLERLGRNRSSADFDLAAAEQQKNRFRGLKDAISSLGGAMEPQSDLEKSALKVKLANAGFRSESAPMVYQGIRFVSMAVMLLPALALRRSSTS
jgi:tight adherence protein C